MGGQGRRGAKLQEPGRVLKTRWLAKPLPEGLPDCALATLLCPVGPATEHICCSEGGAALKSQSPPKAFPAQPVPCSPLSPL